MEDTLRPRILFEEVSDALFAELSPLAGIADRIGDPREVHGSDWDLCVSFASEPTVLNGWHLLAFGGDLIRNFGGHGYLSRHFDVHARAVEVSAKCDPWLRPLVSRTIVDPAPPPPRKTFSASLPQSAMPLAVVGEEEYVHSYFQVHDDGEGPLCALVLPRETASPREWLVAYLEHLAEVDAGRFPSRPDWQKGREWAGARLSRALTTLEGVLAEREGVLASLASREAEAKREVEVAAMEAAHGPQRCLTGTGPELVDAVVGILADLGFLAQDMDAHHDAKTGAKLEDLRITDPQVAAWTCLAEVKGYSKGAKVTDISQIAERPASNFAREEGRDPDALWHVVNTWRAVDPSVREASVPNDNDLASLTRNAGALIDTRDLFRAWRDVQDGVVEAQEVRDSLRSALTRWSWPAR